MGKDSSIEWTHHTFNPWRGCSRVSPGCQLCYAERQAKRNPAVLGEWGPSGTRIVASEATWKEPLRWDREAMLAGVRRRVFCASIADVFEDWRGQMLDTKGRTLSATNSNGDPMYAPLDLNATDQYGPIRIDVIRARLFRLINATPHLDWLLLTKRPQNVVPIVEHVARHIWRDGRLPRNCWCGVSVEDQPRADERIPLLLQVPAAVRFLSVEPLLGPVKLGGLAWPPAAMTRQKPDEDWSAISVNWVICGGESGPDARPCQVEWIRSIVRQCREAGTACFVKQLGSNPWLGESEHWPHVRGDVTKPLTTPDGFGRYHLTLVDRKGGDPQEWPGDLRIQEFPAEANP